MQICFCSSLIQLRSRPLQLSSKEGRGGKGGEGEGKGKGGEGRGEGDRPEKGGEGKGGEGTGKGGEAVTVFVSGLVTLLPAAGFAAKPLLAYASQTSDTTAADVPPDTT